MRLYSILTEKTIPTEPTHAIHEGKVEDEIVSHWAKAPK